MTEIVTKAEELVGCRVRITTTYDYTHRGRIGHVAAPAYLDLIDIEDGGAQRRVQLDTILDLSPAED